MKLSSKEAARLLAAGGVEMPSIDELVYSCERHLRDGLAAAGVTPVPSNASHDELVGRILAQRKPTKPARRDEHGRQRDDQPEDYRDQLLWAMVRQSARRGALIFVSDNTADFANEQAIDRTRGRAELHADLLQDLEEDRVGTGGADDVALYLTVRRVADELLPQPDNEDDRAEMQMAIVGVASESFGLAVRAAIASQAVDVHGYLPPVPLTSDVEEAMLETLDPGIEAHVLDAYQESEGVEPRRYVVSLDVQGQGTVAWHVSAVSSYDLEALAPLVESPDAGGLIQSAESCEAVHLSVAGIYVPSENAWEDVEVDWAEQPTVVSDERAAQVPDPLFDALVEEYELERERRTRSHGAP